MRDCDNLIKLYLLNCKFQDFGTISPTIVDVISDRRIMEYTSPLSPQFAFMYSVIELITRQTAD